MTGERLLLDSKTQVHALGPNLTLEGCSVTLRVSARALVLSEVRFIDCDIEVKQELKNLSWADAYMKGCRITGRLSGCDFGRWRESSGSWGHGGIEDCDFSGARLDLCRFHDCDPRALRLPTWPCFTILGPLAHGAELSRVPWPEAFGEVIIKKLPTHPASTVAISYHAPSIARYLHTTAEALLPLLQPFDFIVR